MVVHRKHKAMLLDQDHVSLINDLLKTGATINNCYKHTNIDENTRSNKRSTNVIVKEKSLIATQE